MSKASPFLPMTAIGVFRAMVLPGCAMILRSTPPKGDWYSIVALSVSISQSEPPSSTVSPSFFNQLATAPSSIVSLSFGISTMLAMALVSPNIKRNFNTSQKNSAEKI